MPLLKSRGEDITRHFYRAMLTGHPELKAFFNEAHQAEGTQARALAGAVLAYASHIDRVHELAPALPRIIQKHVALGVQPAHYPIVGACLLAAIREVLGADVATDEIIAAWAEAYGALAQLLIDAEEQVYAATAALPGGWRGQREMVVARKERESELITSFYLEPVDGQPLPPFQPGQDLTLVLDLPVAVGLARAGGRGEGEDRFEGKGAVFHEHLRQAFLEIAMREPKRCAVVDATGSVEGVAAAILEVIERRLTP